MSRNTHRPRGTALGRVVRAGVARRRVQTAVMVLTTLLSVAAAVLAVGLLVVSQEPFDRAFSRQSGAHLTVQFDGSAVTAAQAAATARAAGVAGRPAPSPSPPYACTATEHRPASCHRRSPWPGGPPPTPPWTGSA